MPAELQYRYILRTDKSISAIEIKKSAGRALGYAGPACSTTRLLNRSIVCAPKTAAAAVRPVPENSQIGASNAHGKVLPESAAGVEPCG